MTNSTNAISQWTLVVLALTALASCSTTPSDKNLLPDEGPTTRQVYDQHLAGEIAGADDSQRAIRRHSTVPFHGQALLPPNVQAPSARSQAHINELKRDFQRVPNPDILGYVYPHLSASGDLPVPGYYTLFPLYERDHYAEPGEGVVALQP